MKPVNFLLVSTKIISIVFLSACFATTSYAFKAEEDPNTAIAREGVGDKAADKAADKADALQKEDIDRFTNAIAQIKDFYVQKTSDKKLLENAIRGMLSGLDPHSEYLDEDSYKTLLMTTTGAFGGLGVEVTGEYGVLKVISPIDDTPAAKAGMKSGDYIVAINNKLVSEMSLNEAVDSMRGEKGTQVTLTVIRKGDKAPINYKLTREIIHISSVKSNRLGNGFGYVRISEFQEPTTEMVATAIKKLKKEAGGHLAGLVLDLRNNPGGLLEVAVQVSDLFLNNTKTHQYHDLIVYAEGRFPNAKYSAKATHADDILDGAPLVVLVNAGSASASEIVAGALQDYHRAIIVGINSFGKGSVQTILPLDEKHAIKLTTALYHTPSGRIIQNKGIVPDVVVEDLKVEGNKIDTAMLVPIREFELKGHLLAKKTTSTTPAVDEKVDAAAAAADSVSLAQSDFQLYQAVKILKTVIMLDKEQNVLTAQHNSVSNK